MPNIKSQIKRDGTNKAANAKNSAEKNRVRTAIKKVEALVEEGKKEEAKAKSSLTKGAKEFIAVVVRGIAEIASLETQRYDHKQNGYHAVDVGESAVDWLTDNAYIEWHHKPPNKSTENGAKTVDNSIGRQCFEFAHWLRENLRKV